MDQTTSEDSTNAPSGVDELKVRTSYSPNFLAYKLLKSLALTEIWFAMGMTVAIITPTMDDLVELFKVDVEKVSRVLVAKSVGMLAGSVTLATMSDKFRQHIDMFIAIETLVMCGSMAAVPWAPNLTVACVLFCVSGIAWGGISSGGNSMVLMMWGEKAAAPLQFIHNGFGLGTTFTPLIVAPFLSNSHQNSTLDSSDDYDGLNCTFYTCGRDFYSNTSFSWYSSSETHTRIYIPYGICGLLGVLGAGLMLIFYCRGLPQQMLDNRSQTESRSWLQLFNPRSCSGGHLGFGFTMVFGLFALYFTLVAKDSLGTFVQTYAVNALNFSKPTASLMTTTYFGGYTLGRYAGMALAFCVPIPVALFAEAILELVAATALVLWGLNTHLGFWITSVAFGFFAGPMYPAGMAWADRYIEVTSLVVSVIDLGIGVGYMGASWLGGYLYTYVGKQYVMYQVLACSVLFVVILTCIQIVACVHGNRFEKQEESQAVQKEDSKDVDETSPLIN